jgi:thioesterase domain-containing protein
MNAPLMNFSCVFPISEPEESVGTLVYFHPGGLSSDFVRRLAALFTDWRIVNVELMLCSSYVEAVDRNNVLKGSIETVAAEIKSQLEVDANQPLIFAGWSFGGVIAFQMASEWVGSNRPKLLMFDSIAPVSNFSFSDKNVASGLTLKWFVQYVQALKSCKLIFENQWWKKPSEMAVLQDLLEQAKCQNSFDERTHIAGFKKVFSSFTKGLLRNSKLSAAYQPRRCQSDLLLIRAKYGLLKRFMWIRHMGWKSLVDGITVKTVPFDHYQVIANPRAVQQLAMVIDDFLYSELKLEHK